MNTESSIPFHNWFLVFSFVLDLSLSFGVLRYADAVQ